MTDDAPQLRGEVRKLSSMSTEAREVLLFVFAGVLTVVALGSVVMGNALQGLGLLGVSAAVWVAALLIGGLKVVETDGFWLLASDRSKTVWIPLRQVVSVRRVWGTGDRVSVELGCDTPFGREIVFEPRLELGAFVGQHPVVVELRELVARAKAAEAHPGSGISNA